MGSRTQRPTQPGALTYAHAVSSIQATLRCANARPLSCQAGGPKVGLPSPFQSSLLFRVQRLSGDLFLFMDVCSSVLFSLRI